MVLNRKSGTERLNNTDVDATQTSYLGRGRISTPLELHFSTTMTGF